MVGLNTAVSRLSGDSEPYCLLPENVSRLDLPMLFIRFGAFIQKDTFKSSRTSRQLLWEFLSAYPQVLVVLIPDDDFSIKEARLGQLVPSLGCRIIGSIDDSMLDPILSINYWRESFGTGSRYAILDDRISFYDDRSRLIPIDPAAGLTQLNTDHAIDLLKLADNIISDPTLTPVERLEIATSLQLCGQQTIATQLLNGLIEELFDGRVDMKHPDGQPKAAIANLLEQRSSLENYYRVANYLGVRLRVISEAAM